MVMKFVLKGWEMTNILRELNCLVVMMAKPGRLVRMKIINSNYMVVKETRLFVMRL